MATGRGEVVGRGLGEFDGAEEIRIEKALKPARVGGQHAGATGATHAEKKVVEAPERPQALAHDPAPLPRMTEIGRHAPDRGATAITGLDRATHAVARPAHDEHTRTGQREMPREHESESGRAARDDHPPILPHHVVSAGSDQYARVDRSTNREGVLPGPAVSAGLLHAAASTL